MEFEATLFAGIPAGNPNLYRRVRVAVGDPAAWLQFSDGRQLVIIRDIEMGRAKAANPNVEVCCPADFTPAAGLDADRGTATAQAVAECLFRTGVQHVRCDRTLPFIFAWHLSQLGLTPVYDCDLGVLDRRQKSDEELSWLQDAQAMTEAAMEMACGTIASAKVDSAGVLFSDGAPLTSERVQRLVSLFLLDRGYSNPSGSIVATAPHSADCHDSGAGPLRTGIPVIVDIFPRCDATLYYGDCTRTVVHGEPSETVKKMHAAVVASKHAATELLLPGNRAETVHEKVIEVLTKHGFTSSRGTVSDGPTIQHGTGHGIGLEVHEPILLDHGGGPMLENEVFTVEPGLYGRLDGGVRVEDMIVVTSNGPRNLNHLHEGLDWRTS